MNELGANFEGDLFSRALFAQTLESYIAEINDGFTIGIQGQWGDGKSWFCRHWAAKLKNEGRSVVYLDAFENDYFDEPFNFIMSGLAAEFQLESTETTKEIVALGKKIGVGLMSVSTKLALTAIGVPPTLLGHEDDIANAIEDAVASQIDGYASRKSDFNAFKEKLKEYCASKLALNRFPVILVIDELDRCSPSYAIKVLERVKHFFDIQGLVVVLPVHRDQLEAAVSGVYGAKIDSTAYLHKFIHLFFELPKKRGVRASDQTDVSSYCLSAMSRLNVSTNAKDQFSVTFARIAVLLDFSFREIEKSSAAYVLAIKQLGGDVWAPVLCVLVALKVKQPNLYNAIQNRDQTVRPRIYELLMDAAGDEEHFKKRFSTIDAIFDIHFNGYSEEDNTHKQWSQLLWSYKSPNDALSIVLRRMELNSL